MAITNAYFNSTNKHTITVVQKTKGVESEEVVSFNPNNPLVKKVLKKFTVADLEANYYDWQKQETALSEMYSQWVFTMNNPDYGLRNDEFVELFKYFVENTRRIKDLVDYSNATGRAVPVVEQVSQEQETTMESLDEPQVEVEDEPVGPPTIDPLFEYFLDNQMFIKKIIYSIKNEQSLEATMTLQDEAILIHEDHIVGAPTLQPETIYKLVPVNIASILECDSSKKEDLFKLKLEVFEMEQVRESTDREWKSRMRKAKSALELIGELYVGLSGSSDEPSESQD